MAAGDGVIEKLGRNGGYGKYIRIRHNGTYSTAYAHMNGYRKGLRRGKRVKQGQIIGYVGSTGRSTGPHLHYEVLKNGRQMNPLKVKMPTGRKLKGNLFAELKKTVAKTRTRMAKAPMRTQIASAE
jgi:murein DD-endopeptidase MepM/ murein hydrolase activator NlpD